MEALRILAAALFTAGVCIAAGRAILRDACADAGAHFVVGAAALSTLVFALCALGIAYPWVMYPLTAALVAAVCRGLKLPRPRWTWAMLPFAAYFVLYLCHAMAPEASADGAGYHLGLVARYLREHGFVRITDNMYAAFPAAMEMLYLFAFPIGRHSAASMVHLAFLLALAWQMFRWNPRVGYAAALLVFASPLMGVDATSAYNDVGLAAAAFTLFRLIEDWRERPSVRLALSIGLIAGFCVGIKYTGALAIPYAIAMIGRRNRKHAMVAAGAAAVVFMPWLLKNWIYLQNPLAPLYNRWFPNPYVMAAFEDTYRHTFSAGSYHAPWSIPIEAAVRGGLTGVLGPVFLLAPLGLLALRTPQGHRIWLAAAVFGATYPSNIGARFLLPVAPFLALAICLALRSIPRVALGLALVHALISWPAIVPRYAARDTWRLERFPWREALRIKPPDHYLETHLIGYGIDRLIEQKARPEATVFSFTPIPEAYTSRHIRIEYQAAENKIAGTLLWTAVEPSSVPTWRVRFTFPARTVRGIRLRQVGRGPAQWTIHELRLYDGQTELQRDASWKLTARPYPWGIQDAFDNSMATFWMCGEFLYPGQYVQVSFGGERRVDSVLMESAPNQTGLKLELDALDGAGNWSPLAAEPMVFDTARPLGLRRAISQELKRRGIDYILLFDGQVGADDFRINADLWNAAPVGQYREARLYELR